MSFTQDGNAANVYSFEGEQGMPIEDHVERVIHAPDAIHRQYPDLFQRFVVPITVFEYRNVERNWTLSVATVAEKGKEQFSLGGFRIVPQERAELPGFSPIAESIGLALGMEQKVRWSRMVRVAGPNSRKHLSRVVGGKCVLLPTPGSRVGEKEDTALLSFAVSCLHDMNRTHGVLINTGQDLGHGRMSDGRLSSLEFLHSRFEGSIVADTSLPTAVGNFHVLEGALAAYGKEIGASTIGVIGCGNIGTHILERLRERGAEVWILEASPARRAELEREGLSTFAPSQKREFLRLPLDALVINASGGTLDTESIKAVSENSSIEIVCGCENLIMPNPQDEEVLKRSQKIFCPTEYCGMMGYLTAFEEYVSSLERTPFSISAMVEASADLTKSAKMAAEFVRESGFSISFRDAVGKCAESFQT
ncbi:MAG: NAD(P)-binding domain-containing protein [Bdellovibrionales bacterium]|nr:NAD(P)-binding domain-containing protein [Bdellovibrionales bacterium]